MRRIPLLSLWRVVPSLLRRRRAVSHPLPLRLVIAALRRGRRAVRRRAAGVGRAAVGGLGRVRGAAVGGGSSVFAGHFCV